MKKLYWLSALSTEDLTDPDLDLSAIEPSETGKHDVFGTANFFNNAAVLESVRLIGSIGVDRVFEHTSNSLSGSLTEWTAAGSRSWIACADLNAGPGSALVEPLTKVTTDAWVASGAPGEGVTLSSQNPFAPLEAVNQIDRRIDYVLVRHGHRGQHVEVTHAELAGNHPSRRRLPIITR